MSLVLIPAAGLSGDSLREAAAAEFGAVTELVVAALRRHYGLASNDFIWPHSIYPDRVIVRRDGKLFEFPYTLSATNEVTLGAATEVVVETKAVTTSKLREAAATELGQVTGLVGNAVRAKVRSSGGESLGYCSITAIYPDRAIVFLDNRMYAYPYTLNDDNTVTVGERSEVVIDHKPVALREAADDAAESWFVEALQDKADKPARYLVRVIQSGVSKNGVSYPAKVLRESAPLFNGARVFVKSDDVHIKGGGKDFRQLVGRLTEARFVETAKDRGEVQAVMDVFESSDVAPRLREAVQRDMTALFGLSIDANGTSKPSGKFREATKLISVASVDLIIEPGAGGQILRFAEAHQEPDMLRQQMLDQIRGRDASRADALATASDDEVLTAYREAFSGQAPAASGITADDLDQRMRLVEARADARTRVHDSKLPKAAQDRLNARFLEAKSADELTADKVDLAIAGEVEYGNTFRESAPVSGLGAISVEAGETQAQAVDRMFDDFFSGKNRTLSFREAYIDVTGDRGVTGLMRNADAGRLAEAAGTFREAVSAATFGEILGNSITRRLQELYRNNARYADWRDLVDIVPIRDFRTQERNRMGGYGNLPDVPENAPYAPLATPGEEGAEYAVTKRGGTETLSLEAISNDDVGLIRRIPQSLETAASRTLYEYVLAFLGTNPAIFDGKALFHTDHANLGVLPLATAGFAAARLRMQKQQELSSGKRMGLVLSHLYVPSDLEEAAFDMFVRNTNNDETFVQSRKPKVHVVPHWTDANNWYATADKSEIPLIELGFLNGAEEPELFIQDNPTQGSLFSNDQIKYKIRHIYGGSVLDWRGFDGSVVP